MSRPTTPNTQPLPGITCARFSLIRFRSPLLTESLLFSLPVGTEMFHFPTFPPHALCVQARVTPHDWCGVPPFGHPRINARLAAPRGLSQPPTSFIGSWCPGIHRVPLTTCPRSTINPTNQQHEPDHHARHPHHHRRRARERAVLDYKMLASTVQFSTSNPTPPRADPTGPATRPHEGADTTTGLRSETIRTRKHPHPRHPPPPGARTGRRGPFPQDPTARLRPPPPPARVPHPAHRAVLAREPARPAELVSVPPSSTTQAPRAPTGTGGHVVVLARLCTPTPTPGTAASAP